MHGGPETSPTTLTSLLPGRGGGGPRCAAGTHARGAGGPLDLRAKPGFQGPGREETEPDQEPTEARRWVERTARNGVRRHDAVLVAQSQERRKGRSSAEGVDPSQGVWDTKILAPRPFAVLEVRRRDYADPLRALLPGGEEAEERCGVAMMCSATRRWGRDGQPRNSPRRRRHARGCGPPDWGWAVRSLGCV